MSDHERMPLLVQTDGGEYVPSVRPKKDSYPRVLAAVAAGSALMLLGTARVAFRDGYDSFNAPANEEYPALAYSREVVSTSAVPADAARLAPRRAHPSGRLGQTDETASGDATPASDADPCASYQPRLATRAHVFGIGIDSENDKKNTEYMKEWLGKENCMSPEQVNAWLTISPGVDAYNWPDKFEDAEYSVRDLEKTLAETTEGALGLGNLYYAGAVAEARENHNTLPEGWAHIAHHVGCMYGHMYQWQKMWDEEWNDAVVLESDAPWSISIPAFSFQEIIRHQPSDYDMMFLCTAARSRASTCTLRRARPGVHSRLHVYRWNQMQGAAGLQGYVMQRRMKDKIEKYIVKTGGMDMVDAWLMIRVCSSVQPDTGTYPLNCYHVSPDPPRDREVVLRDPDVVNGEEGYVRVPRFELNSYPEEWSYDTGGEEAAPKPEPDEDATAATGQQEAEAPAAAETAEDTVEDAVEDAVEELAAAADAPEAAVEAAIAATSAEEVSYEDATDGVAADAADTAEMEARQTEAGKVAEAVGEMTAEAPEPAPEEAAATTEETAAAAEPASASEEDVDAMMDFEDVDAVLDVSEADHDAYESSYGDTMDAAEAPAGSEREDAEAIEHEAPDAAAAVSRAEEALDEEITYEGMETFAFAPAPAPEARR